MTAHQTNCDDADAPRGGCFSFFSSRRLDRAGAGVCSARCCSHRRAGASSAANNKASSMASSTQSAGHGSYGSIASADSISARAIEAHRKEHSFNQAEGDDGLALSFERCMLCAADTCTPNMSGKACPMCGASATTSSVKSFLHTSFE